MSDNFARSRSVGDAVAAARAALRKADVASAPQDARMLVANACGLTVEALLARPEIPLGEDAARRVAASLERRLAGEPVSRITGEREFWGLRFELSPATLDPRPETELLVEAALRHVMIGRLREAPLRLLDLGTGCGCLLGALLTELPSSRGVGVDLSFDALVTARENLRRLGLLPRASFLCGNWADAIAASAFDIVIANPPYVESATIPALDAEVRGYDPRLALDGGGDGLAAFRELGGAIAAVLRRRGFFAVETGSGQAIAVRGMLRNLGADNAFSGLEVLFDLAGRDRAVAGVRQLADVVPLSKKKVGNSACSRYR